MNQSIQVPLWTMLITPVATLLGTMLVVMLGALFQTRHVDAVRNELRAEIHAAVTHVDDIRSELLAEMRAMEERLLRAIAGVEARVTRLEEQRGLVRP